MNRDQVLGRFGKARARMKELAGTLLGHDALIGRARIDFRASRSRAQFGDAKSAIAQRRLIRRRGRLGDPR
jgi:hypothetical protein